MRFVDWRSECLFRVEEWGQRDRGYDMIDLNGGFRLHSTLLALALPDIILNSKKGRIQSESKFTSDLKKQTQKLNWTYIYPPSI